MSPSAIPPMRRRSLAVSFIILITALLSGCATTYTTDDGSAVDPVYLKKVQTLARAEQTMRPAIWRTTQLNDPDCDKQYELPFSVASSYDLKKPAKIAWVRALNIDERSTVIAALPESGLAVGDKIVKVDDYKTSNTDDLDEYLRDRRDTGRPFEVTLSTGKVVPVKPAEVCRGHVEIARPDDADRQDYHWLQSVHTLTLFEADLTADEALWVVLWTQGLSEEAGARMKTYHYGSKVLSQVMKMATLGTGLSNANALASNAGGQILRSAAENQAKSSLADVAQKLLRAQAQDVAITAAAAATINRQSLSGVSWVAGTGFYRADKWAFERMAKLGGDPAVGSGLNQRLSNEGVLRHAFILDAERLELMSKMSTDQGVSRLANPVLANTDASDIATTAAPQAIAPDDSASLEVSPLP